MAILEEPRTTTDEGSARQAAKEARKAHRKQGWGQTVVKWLTSTDRFCLSVV